MSPGAPMVNGPQPWYGPSLPATHVSADRTVGLTIAQLIVGLQVILAFISAINVIKDANDINALTAPLGVNIGNNEIVDAIAVIGLAFVVLIGSLLAGKWRIALWFVVASELAAALFALIVWGSGLGILGFFFQHRDLFLIFTSLTGLAFVHPSISLFLAVVALGGLLSHVRTL